MKNKVIGNMYGFKVIEVGEELTDEEEKELATKLYKCLVDMEKIKVEK